MMIMNLPISIIARVVQLFTKGDSKLLRHFGHPFIEECPAEPQTLHVAGKSMIIHGTI